MTEPILVADFSAGTSVQVYTMEGATFTALGDPFTITEAAVPDANHNCVVHAHGGIYCYTKEGIFKLQTGLVGSVEDTWSSDSADGGVTFASPGGSTARNVGMYYVNIDDEPHLVGVYQSGAGTYTSWRYNLETEVLEEGGNDTSNTGINGHNVYYNGVIISIPSTNIGAIVDPRVLTIKPFAGGNNAGWSINDSNSGVDFNVFNSQLYMLHRANTDGFPSISKFGGGTFSRELTLQSSQSTVSGGKPALFDDGGNMYAIIYHDGVSDGWRAWEIDTTGGVLSLGDEISSTILPSSLQLGGGTTNTSRWVTYKNPLSDGTYEIILWHAANNTGGTFSQYRWNGPGAPMTLQDTGGDSQYCLANTKRGGGDRIFDQTEATISVHAHEAVAGGERVSFTCFGGQTDQIVRFYIGIDGGAPTTQATLSGAAIGGSAARNGNQVELVDCDGVTSYTITIANTVFDNNERIELVARVSDT